MRLFPLMLPSEIRRDGAGGCSEGSARPSEWALPHASGGAIAEVLQQLREAQHGFERHGREAQRLHKHGGVQQQPGDGGAQQGEARAEEQVVLESAPLPEVLRVQVCGGSKRSKRVKRKSRSEARKGGRRDWERGMEGKRAEQQQKQERGSSWNWSLIRGCVEIPAILNQRAARLLTECNRDECDSLELFALRSTRITFSEAARYIQRVLLPFIVAFSLTNLFIKRGFFSSPLPAGTPVYSSAKNEDLLRST